MNLQTIKTDEYYLLLDTDVKGYEHGRWFFEDGQIHRMDSNTDWTYTDSPKIIAQLPINVPPLQGVPLLPELPKEEDVEAYVKFRNAFDDHLIALIGDDGLKKNVPVEGWDKVRANDFYKRGLHKHFQLLNPVQGTEWVFEPEFEDCGTNDEGCLGKRVKETTEVFPVQGRQINISMGYKLKTTTVEERKIVSGKWIKK